MKANVHVFSLSILLACGSLIPGAAFADLGNFNITSNCPANRSLHHQNDNPGNVTVKPGETYTAANLNKPGGDYVLLKIPGIPSPMRWVELTCGKLGNDPVSTPTPAPKSPVPSPAHGNNKPQPQTPESSASSKSGKFLLSASWQPAFCESSAGQGKQECVTQTNKRFDATHFTLHGLWPQPNGNFYCTAATKDKSNDETHNWDALPEPKLSDDTRAKLDIVMPGTQSNLQRHEWTKHGTCFGTGPETYFGTAISLMDQLNNSAIQKLVASNIGKEVATADLQAAFEQSFGPSSASALAIDCSKGGGRTLISGISINLQGSLNPTTKLQSVLDTSQHPKSQCAQGVIDPAGKH